MGPGGWGLTQETHLSRGFPVVLLHWALERDLKVKGAIDTKIETRWGSVAQNACLLGIWVSA